MVAKKNTKKNETTKKAKDTDEKKNTISGNVQDENTSAELLAREGGENTASAGDFSAVLGTDITSPVYFHVSMVVEGSNPNGDPMDEGRPRILDDGLGFITNLCVARKIRDAAALAGLPVLLQSDSKRTDGFTSVQSRVAGNEISIKAPRGEIKRALSDKFFDVRLRGVTLALPSKKGESEKGFALSMRAALSLTDAKSVEPVRVVRMQITRSHNAADGLPDGEKGSETMGMRYVVEHGVYTFFGAITPFTAAVTGLVKKDVEELKNILPLILDNDQSVSRPYGSFYIRDIAWWDMESAGKRMNPGRICKAMRADPVTGELVLSDTELGVKPEMLEVW